MRPTRYGGLEWTGYTAAGRERYEAGVRGLSESERPDDSAKELLVYANAGTRDRAEKALLSSGVAELERIDLLRLDPLVRLRGETFGDYAVESRSGGLYIDSRTAALFSLDGTKPGAEPGPALRQMEEHLIGAVECDGGLLYIIDAQLAELAERIARAYGCSAALREWSEFSSERS